MKQEKFSLYKRLISFKYAINGIKVLLNEEPNSRIHVVASLFAIVFSFVLHLSVIEWLFVIFSIGLVFAMELINSAIENLCDEINKETDPSIKKIKDLAAGAVLVSAGSAFIVGLIIFLPKVWSICFKH
ncbi:MAG: diacylglycerol kinase family protein [Saprospiraceae bacterium]